MIYGIIDGDPEDGEDCVMLLSNSLGELLYKINNLAKCLNKVISDFYIVKHSKYNSWKDVKSDHHFYYPEIEPFLWNTKGWLPVDKSKIKQLCVKLNYTYEDSKSNQSLKQSAS